MSSGVAPYEAERISNGIGSWVRRELTISLSSRNSYLDDLAEMRKRMALEAEDPGNFVFNKFYSHMGRQTLWGQAMVESPGDDFLMARHIFNALMQLSGVAKKITYFTSSNQRDYFDRKTSDNFVGVDLKPVVAATLAEDSPTPEALQGVTMNEFEITANSLLFLRTRIPDDFDKEESPAVNELAKTQFAWVRVVTLGIMVAANHREGNLSAIPFLEPKSITDEPQVYFPFAEAG
jgi:hypothetical protein